MEWCGTTHMAEAGQAAGTASVAGQGGCVAGTAGVTGQAAGVAGVAGTAGVTGQGAGAAGVDQGFVLAEVLKCPACQDLRLKFCSGARPAQADAPLAEQPSAPDVTSTLPETWSRGRPKKGQPHFEVTAFIEKHRQGIYQKIPTTDAKGHAYSLGGFWGEGPLVFLTFPSQCWKSFLTHAFSLFLISGHFRCQHPMQAFHGNAWLARAKSFSWSDELIQEGCLITKKRSSIKKG